MHGKINLPRSRHFMSILHCAWLLVHNPPSKADLHPRQTTTMHAYYLYTNRLEIQTYIDQTINSSWIGMGKTFSLLLKMSQLTKVETDHLSLNLILGSSSPILQLLFRPPKHEKIAERSCGLSCSLNWNLKSRLSDDSLPLFRSGGSTVQTKVYSMELQLYRRVLSGIILSLFRAWGT